MILASRTLYQEQTHDFSTQEPIFLFAFLLIHQKLLLRKNSKLTPTKAYVLIRVSSVTSHRGFAVYRNQVTANGRKGLRGLQVGAEGPAKSH